MKNKSKLFKTIQSSDIFELDELYLQHKSMGWKKLEGGYSNSWGRIHSQILMLETKKYNFIKYFENGEIKILGNIVNDKKEGLWYSFNINSNIQQTGNFNNGLEDGEWIFYNSDGSIKKKEIYKNGEILEFIKDNETIKFK